MSTLNIPTTADFAAIPGHNNPPTPMEVIRESLTDKHAKLLQRASDLSEAGTRLPTRIDDEDTAGKITDFIKQITGAHKTIEAARVSEKEPYLTMGRAVDGFFKIHTDSLAKVKILAQKPLDDYLKHKADAERARRIEEARQMQQEAEAKAAAALALQAANMPKAADQQMDGAVLMQDMANDMAKTAAARPAELAKSRGADGASASLRTRWIGELIDRDKIDLEQLRAHIPLEALQKALNSFVAAGGRNLRGACIYEKSEAVVR